MLNHVLGKAQYELGMNKMAALGCHLFDTKLPVNSENKKWTCKTLYSQTKTAKN